MKRGPRILLFVGLIAAFPFVIDALVETDAERIASLVERTLEMVESKDSAGIADLLSEGFEDHSGALKSVVRDGAERTIARLLESWEDIDLDPHSSEIEVDGDRAVLQFECGVLARPRLSRSSKERSRLPLRATLRVILEREDDGEWRYRELEKLDAALGL